MDTSQTRVGNATGSFVSRACWIGSGQVFVTACREEVGGEWDRHMVIHCGTM